MNIKRQYYCPVITGWSVSAPQLGMRVSPEWGRMWAWHSLHHTLLDGDRATGALQSPDNLKPLAIPETSRTLWMLKSCTPLSWSTSPWPSPLPSGDWSRTNERVLIRGANLLQERTPDWYYTVHIETFWSVLNTGAASFQGWISTIEHTLRHFEVSWVASFGNFRGGFAHTDKFKML